ncbi:hypothetical protein CVS40_0929 [Lucilia cuprina]|nr:hypothetical protein CVS40_0929 [Lucilia cuprina]
MSSIAPNMYQCNVCSKVYKYRKSFLEHVERHSQPQNIPMMNLNQMNQLQPHHAQMMMNSNHTMDSNQIQYGVYPQGTYIQYPFMHYPMNNQQMDSYHQYYVQNAVPIQYCPTSFYPIHQYPQYGAPMIQVQNPDYQTPFYQQQQQPQQQNQDQHVNNLEQQIDEENEIENLTQHSNNEMDISVENYGNDNVTEHFDEDYSNNEMDVSPENGGDDNVTEHVNKDYYIIRNAFKNNIISYGIPNKKEDILLEDFIKDKQPIFKDRIESGISKHMIIKFNISIICEYIKIADEDMNMAIITHRAKMNLLTRGDDIENLISNQFKEIESKMSQFQERDSGWTLIRIIRGEININKSSLVKGSKWISTPPKLAKRHACINIENNDDYCFKWCIIAAMDTNYINNFQRINSYNIINDISSAVIRLQNNVVIDFSSLLFPLNLKSISTFEKNNPNISINVFGYDEENDEIVGPFYLTKEEKIKHINLMLLENTEGFHYILISNMSRLLKNQFTKHNTKLHFCNSCLQYTHDVSTMENHKMECGKIVTHMPTPQNNCLRFKNYQCQLDIPFVVYADFECILENIQTHVSGKTSFIQKHLPCAFSYFIKCGYNDNLSKFEIYSGSDAGEVFVKSLIKDCRDIYNNYLRNIIPMPPLTAEENEVVEF